MIARPTKGSQTRTEILGIAAQIASAEGLEGLSLGRLAEAVGMSKSGLRSLSLQAGPSTRRRGDSTFHVHQRSNPTRRRCAERTEKAAQARGGLAVLRRRDVFRGGCFFVAASLEFDGRPGVVKDRITEIMGEWLRLLENEVRKAKAKANDELTLNADPLQLAFEFNSQNDGSKLGLPVAWGQESFCQGENCNCGKTRRIRRTARAPPPFTGVGDCAPSNYAVKGAGRCWSRQCSGGETIS